MSRKDQLLAVLGVLLLVGAVKIGQQLYYYYVFRTERIAIVRLEGEVDAAGIGVIRTQLRADSLREVIQGADEELATFRGELDRDEGLLLRGAASETAEHLYRERFAAYEERVAERNDLFRVWRTTVEDNHSFVDRYNALADSIRMLATAMGEPYYPVRTPAEIADSNDRASRAP